jgi:hypothetical protein
MDPAFRIVLLAFGITGGIGLLIYLLITYRDKKRTAALTTVAQSLGFMFLGEEWNGSALEPQQLLFENSVVFEQGWGQKCKNIMRGTFSGLQASIFDYSYITGRGRGAHTWQQTVFAFSHDLSLPAFDLKPENFMDRLRDAFNHNDIDFDSHPEFSRRYFLRSPRQERTKELFTPELLRYLEGLPPEPKWHIEGNGQTLFIYLFNRRTVPENISAFAQNTSSIATSFFRYCGAKPEA